MLLKFAASLGRRYKTPDLHIIGSCMDHNLYPIVGLRRGETLEGFKCSILHASNCRPGRVDAAVAQ